MEKHRHKGAWVTLGQAPRPLAGPGAGSGSAAFAARRPRPPHARPCHGSATGSDADDEATHAST